MSYCWICGLPADSAEHRIKKSDLTTLHGSGPYKDSNALVLLRAGKQIPIQGPNSKYVKYDKSLCCKCNNEFTQPFDRAYEKFIEYIRANKSIILKKRFIDFEDVYGSDCETGQRNLFKYLVKSFGCRLIDAGYLVPKDLKILLFKVRFQTRLRINFAINDDLLLLKDIPKMVGKGDLLSTVPGNKNAISQKNKYWEWIFTKIQPPIYQWSEFFEWMRIFYWYNKMPDGRLGSIWIADSQFIYFGSDTPLSTEEREELIDKLEK